MKLSAQEEYGLRCLLQLGQHEEQTGEGLTIPEISQAEGLSVPNAAKLMRLLRRGGFVESVRGQSGGYRLSRSPDRIVIGEVLTVLGGRLYDPDFCRGHTGVEESCAHSMGCTLRPLWNTLQSVVDQVVESITLKDLLGESQGQGLCLKSTADELIQVSSR